MQMINCLCTALHRRQSGLSSRPIVCRYFQVNATLSRSLCNKVSLTSVKLRGMSEPEPLLGISPGELFLSILWVRPMQGSSLCTGSVEYCVAILSYDVCSQNSVYPLAGTRQHFLHRKLVL